MIPGGTNSHTPFLTDPTYLEVAVATTATITVYNVEDQSTGQDDYLAEISLLVWLVGVRTSVVQWLGRHSLGL